jgi:multidrug efflux pump
VFDRVIAGPSLAEPGANHPWLTLGAALSTLALSVMLWVFIPKVSSRSRITALSRAPPGAAVGLFASMAQRQRRCWIILKIRRGEPDLVCRRDGTNPALNSAVCNQPQAAG